MINRNKFILFLLFLVIITVPISFAGDIDGNITTQADESVIDVDSSVLEIGEYIEENTTPVLESSDEEIIGAGDVYFDASATSDGSGTQSNPYITVSSSKLGTNNHFAPGTYVVSSSLSSSFSFSSSAMTFSGDDRDNTIIKFTGSGIFMSTSSDVTFSGITLVGCHFVSTGGLFTATNTVFDSGQAEVELEADNTYYDNSYGGAIKQSISSSGFDWGSIFGGSSTTGMKITDCVFKNNFAAYGGAIYVEGGTAEITNTKFESNTAKNYGGAIAGLNGVDLTVSGCEFNGDYSFYDAGGAIYIYNVTKASIKNSYFNDCMATFGSAITSLKSTVTVSGSNFNRNKASWQGGAIYSMYGQLTVTSSNFFDNGAKSGGAIFADNLTSFTVNGGIFQRNAAEDAAGAIFAFANKVNSISTDYSSNSANLMDNLYETDKIELIIGSDDYEMIQYRSSYNGVLPSKYDLRTTGGVTPVENQGQSGNCWAFATMATLESAILKATGRQFDLSEGNLKNLACKFSDIGWDYETNEGGMYPFVLGYLTSWAGPVNASMDPTDDWDLLAPILNSVVHVQNVLFLQRTSFTDNSAIKKAIMDYGAVCSEIYWSNSYLNGNNYYYSGDPQRNHAISVVGWDDSKSISGAPGAGAWIIKNSYGPTRGDGGYYYVSYYDKSLFKLYDESYNSFAIVFNDTIRFNKNYQYDAAFTDYFMTGAKEMWYKNTFTSTGNDLLQAFSTYFRKVTTWEAQIFVNDELKLTQSGKTNFGYYTINLNEPIPLKTGDKFTISLKIQCSSSADIPISESGPAYTLVKEYFKPGVSFFSRDGSTWTDFYGYKATYGSGDSGHNYFNQVACIKAFTSEGPKEFLNTTIEIISVNSTNVVVSIKDQRGGSINTGEVQFIIDGNVFTASVSKSSADYKIYLKAGKHNIQANYIQNQYYNASSTSKTVTLSKENPIITISADSIQYGQDLEVKITVKNAIGNAVNIPFSVDLNGKKYTQNQFKVSHLTPKIYTIKVNTDATDDFNATSATKLVWVSAATTSFNIEISDVDVDEMIKVKAVFLDNITDYVDVVINGKTHKISVNNGVGEISIDNTLTAGQYTAIAKFMGNDYYSPVNATKMFNVNKISPVLTIFDDDIVEGQTATVVVYLPSDISDTLELSINSNNIYSKAENGRAAFNISGLTLGDYEYTVYFQGNSKYAQTSITDSLSVLQKAKKDVSMNVFASVEGRDVLISVELPSDVTGQLTLNFNSLIFSKTPVNGKTSFRINNLSNDVYDYTVAFVGDVNYKSDVYHNSVKVDRRNTADSTIRADNITRAYLSGYDFQATFTDEYGNLLDNREVLFIVNGNEYYVKTNKYGVSKLSGKFAVGKFNVLVVNLVTGENITKSMNIVSRITDNKNIVMDYASGSVFKVRVYGDNGKVVKSGETVSFKVDGKIYKVKTNKNGYASIKLNLKPKTYTITTEYRGVKLSNKIVVKQILKAKNISKKKAKKIKFTATLKSSKGKAIAGKKITFKIKGKKYSAKTNKKGKATITLKKLKVGKYKITSTYLKTTISNTIKIKK